MCFNFFTHRTKILKFYADPQTAHLQAAQPNAQPKLAKESFFYITHRNINFERYIKKINEVFRPV